VLNAVLVLTLAGFAAAWFFTRRKLKRLLPA
jgi:hypothetical protein